MVIFFEKKFNYINFGTSLSFIDASANHIMPAIVFFVVLNSLQCHDIFTSLLLCIFGPGSARKKQNKKVKVHSGPENSPLAIGA